MAARQNTTGCHSLSDAELLGKLDLNNDGMIDAYELTAVTHLNVRDDGMIDTQEFRAAGAFSELSAERAPGVDNFCPSHAQLLQIKLKEAQTDDQNLIAALGQVRDVLPSINRTAPTIGHTELRSSGPSEGLDPQRFTTTRQPNRRLLGTPVARPGCKPRAVRPPWKQYRDHYAQHDPSTAAEADCQPLFTSGAKKELNRAKQYTPVRKEEELSTDLHRLQQLHHQEQYPNDTELMCHLGRFYAGDMIPQEFGGPSEHSTAGNVARVPALGHLAEPSLLTRPSFGSDDAFGNFYSGSRVKDRHAYTMLLRPDGGLVDPAQNAATMLHLVHPTLGLHQPEGERKDDRSLLQEHATRPDESSWLPPYTMYTEHTPPRPRSFASEVQCSADVDLDAAYAVIGGVTEQVEAALAANQLDPDMVFMNKPLLIHATERNHSAIVELLLRAKADPMSKGVTGLTALQVAIECLNPKLAQLIVDSTN